MIVLVTPNESRLITLMTETASFPPWKVEHLSVGDVMIKKEDEEVPVVVIERKTPSDLWASITDPKKRHATQRDHLLKVKEDYNCLIVYIIEGNVTAHINEIRGCVYSLQTKYGFVVLPTLSMSDTVSALSFLYQKCIEVKPEYRQVPGRINSLKLTPKDDVKLDLWYPYTLMIIPGVSYDKAMSIATSFVSIEDFLDVVRTKDIARIADVKVGQRKIGPSLASKIIANVENALRQKN